MPVNVTSSPVIAPPRLQSDGLRDVKTQWLISAYCPCQKCCGKTDGITASGVRATPHHTIASNGFPFGTKLRIGTRGVYTVEDRGSVKYFGTRTHPHPHLDLFCATHAEAVRFGHQTETVEVIP